MNCPNCGNPMGPEDIFCGVCGARTQPQPTSSVTPNQSQPVAHNPSQPPVAPQPAPPVAPQFSGMPEVVMPTSPVPPAMPEITAPITPVKKKSKKKKILIITAIVTALAIIAGILSWIFIFSKESVWLITSEIHYDTRGIAYKKNTYDYTEKGLPLKFTSDSGGSESIWNEADGIYEAILLPYDGEADATYEYGYNEEGDILYVDEWWRDHDYSQEGAYSYNYDEKGRIESVDCYGALAGGGFTDDVLSVMHYCYDDNGNLIEIYIESLRSDPKQQDRDYITWGHDFRYDSKNRLIGYTNREKEACWYYQFEYNDKDQLTRVTQSSAYSQTRLDDQHVSESIMAHDGEFKVLNEWDFEYDSDGNLISRGDLTCTYDNGKLSTITKDSGITYRYTDEDTGADEDDIVLVRDKNGNIIKEIDPDGSYVEYTYKEFRLSKEEAQYCRNAQMARHRINPTGPNNWQFLNSFDGSDGFLKYIPFPTTDLMQFDIVTRT